MECVCGRKVSIVLGHNDAFGWRLVIRRFLRIVGHFPQICAQYVDVDVDVPGTNRLILFTRTSYDQASVHSL
jgi:hypothetical protein